MLIHVLKWFATFLCINLNNSERPVDALAVKKVSHWLTTWNQEMLAHLKRLLICVYVWRGMFENPDKWDQRGWLSPWAGPQSRLCDTQIQVPEANVPKNFHKYSKFRFSVFEQIFSKPLCHSTFEHFLQRNIVEWDAKRSNVMFLMVCVCLKLIVNFVCFCLWSVLICLKGTVNYFCFGCAWSWFPSIWSVFAWSELWITFAFACGCGWSWFASIKLNICDGLCLPRENYKLHLLLLVVGLVLHP